MAHYILPIVTTQISAIAHINFATSLIGLVMAAELSSTVEPLTHVATLSVHDVMDFLRQVKSHEDTTTCNVFTPEPPTLSSSWHPLSLPTSLSPSLLFSLSFSISPSPLPLPLHPSSPSSVSLCPTLLSEKCIHVYIYADHSATEIFLQITFFPPNNDVWWAAKCIVLRYKGKSYMYNEKH